MYFFVFTEDSNILILDLRSLPGRKLHAKKNNFVLLIVIIIFITLSTGINNTIIQLNILFKGK